MRYKHFSWLTKKHPWQPSVFQNESKNIPSQDFLMTNISCQFEIYTCNTLCSRGPGKVLALSRINVPGGHLVFQNEAKNIPRQHFMVINISCKFEKASYNIVFVRAVMVKSLYTLRLSSGYGKLASWKIGLLEKWPPRKLASLKFVGVENWPPLAIFSGPNVYISLFVLNSALYSSH